jgi:ERCC4-type nuclease
MTPNFVITVDTREQRPFTWPNSERTSLATGDYSIRSGNRDFRERIAIERKSIDDLLSCIGQHRARFERELERLNQIQFSALVVEASLRDVLTPGRSEIHPNAVLGSLVAWSWKFRLPIWLCGDRRLAQMVTERLLTKAAKYAAEDV